jgi:hypothetical protein
MGLTKTHPSGIEDEAELANVSMEFWTKIVSELDPVNLNEAYSHLLTFQQGWQACKEWYKINT